MSSIFCAASKQSVFKKKKKSRNKSKAHYKKWVSLRLQNPLAEELKTYTHPSKQNQTQYWSFRKSAISKNQVGNAEARKIIVRELYEIVPTCIDWLIAWLTDWLTNWWMGDPNCSRKKYSYKVESFSKSKANIIRLPHKHFYINS